MAQPKARLYQRLRIKGFPWVLVALRSSAMLPSGPLAQAPARLALHWLEREKLAARSLLAHI